MLWVGPCKLLSMVTVMVWYTYDVPLFAVVKTGDPFPYFERGALLYPVKVDQVEWAVWIIAARHHVAHCGAVLHLAYPVTVNL